jgi:HEAT repeat protein
MNRLTLLVLCSLGVLPCRAADNDMVAEQAADEKLVRDAGVKPDDAGLLAFFKERTLGADDQRKLAALVRQLGDTDFGTREEATRLLVKRGTSAVPFLKPALKDSDPEIARRAEQCLQEIEQTQGATLACAAVRFLGRRNVAGAIPVLLDYLPFAAEEAVEEEVRNALTALDRGKGDPLLVAALGDAKAVKRGAAGYVVGRSREATARAAAKKLLEDRDVVVRFLAAQGLIHGGEKAAVPVLIDLLGEPVLGIVWQAEELLVRIAGERPLPAQPLPPTDEKERTAYRDRWHAWWREHGAKVDLAKLNESPPYLGFTVVAQMDKGRVLELDRAGKTRWEIKGLSSPIDARVLSGDRVLIAEHGGNIVTERSLDGKIQWKHTLNEPPVAVQRLANGNTFVATYQSVLEVTREGKEVYRHRLPDLNGAIYGGFCLPSGRVFALDINGLVLEVDRTTGKTRRRIQAPVRDTYSVQVLPNEHLLVASHAQGVVVELSRTGDEVWRCTRANAYHAERLPNGNTLVASHPRGEIFEVGRDGKTVNQWTVGPCVWRAHQR